MKETPVKKLKRLMKITRKIGLDQTMNSLIENAEAVPSSMFGADKRKGITLTMREHEGFQTSNERDV